VHYNHNPWNAEIKKNPQNSKASDSIIDYWCHINIEEISSGGNSTTLRAVHLLERQKPETQTDVIFCL